MKRDDCEVFYDRLNDRLIYIGRAADEEYWDEHWIDAGSARSVKVTNRFVLDTTQSFLRAPAKVLDAGCGLAHSVFTLSRAGYDAYGVDYATKTVEFVNRVAPELKVTVADVRDMKAFPDGTFDGVWSLGVVEHFFEGYDSIVLEVRRVLSPGGYAFVTVPSISPLRRIKIALGSYPRFVGETEGFYQFVLSPASIVTSFSSRGFELVKTKARGGVKGLKDETAWLRPVMQPVYDSRNVLVRYVKAAADRVLSPATFHTRLYVFRRT